MSLGDSFTAELRVNDVFVPQTGSTDNEILLGIVVERMLNDKMWRGSNIVGAPISDIRTTVCQNKCSGHGACNSETRACMCETFWMPSVYYFWGISEANCGKLRSLSHPISPVDSVHLIFRLVHFIRSYRYVYFVHCDFDNMLGADVLLPAPDET